MAGRHLKRVIVVALVAFLGWKGYERHEQRRDMSDASMALEQFPPGAPTASHSIETPSAYQCDGRIHCTQMTSCDEAHFFVAHCPGTKMDGDNDGIPCEQQWCTR